MPLSFKRKSKTKQSLNGSCANGITTTPHNAISNSKESTKGGSDGTMSGYLYKWTNYLTGYQKCWFNLSNGLLSYYRSPTEMTHTCRGTINLANASILSEDSCNFVVSNGGAQTFHLKAETESEKQKWVAAIELAKNRAKQENLDSDEDTNTEAEKNEVHTMLKTLQTKLEDLNTCHDLVQKHSGALTKSLIDLESIQNKPDENTVKQINERATLFKITLLAMINACQEFTQLANLQGKKMQKVLQSERDIRAKDPPANAIIIRQEQQQNQQHDGDGHLKNKSEQQQQDDSNGTTGQIAQDHVSKEGNVVSKKALFELHETDYYDDFSNNGANDDKFHDALEDVTVFPVTKGDVEGAPVLNPQAVTNNTQLNTGVSKLLCFTQLAIELNEPEEGVAPTDSRHRPDQQLMEQALWDEANKEKLRFEEKQCIACKQSESLNEKLAGENKQPIQYESQWFRKTVDPYTNQPIHVFEYNNEYWECKQKNDWKRCPDIF